MAGAIPFDQHPHVASGKIAEAKLILLGLVLLVPNLVLPVLVGTFVDVYGFTLSQAGWTAAIYMLGGGVGPCVVGLLLGRLPALSLIGGALVLITTGNTLTYISSDYSLVLFARFLAGFGEGAGLAVVWAALARFKNPMQSFAMFVATGQIFAAGLLWMMPLLIQSLGARAIFVVIALTPVVMMPALYRFPNLLRAGADNERYADAEPSLLRSSRFWFAVGGTFVAYVSAGALWAYLERMGVANGLTAARVSEMLALGSLIGAPAALAARWGTTDRGRNFQIMGCLVLVSIAAICVSFGGSQGAFQFGVILYNVAWFYFVVKLLTLLGNVDTHGKTISFGTGALEFGLAAGPAIAAQLVTITSFSTVGIFCVVGFMAGAALLLRVSASLPATKPAEIFHIPNGSKKA